jgi:exosortase
MRLLLTALILLWLQLFWALVPTWRFGEYYGYGWFVPFLAAGFVWRRWQMLAPGAGMPAPVPGPPPRAQRLPGWAAALGLLAALAMVPLLWIATADPGWRPPLLLLALLTSGLTHLLVWQGFGRRTSLGLLPVTIFALSAVPYPWQFEQQLIRSLTGTVAGITREVFLLTGQPVELLGERLVLGTDAVDVTDGCSGIRSFQSLIMGALFFGELLLLALPKRLVLVAVAGACAVGVNSARAYALAAIHFTNGKDAAATAHDPIGHAAYWVSTAIVFLVALGLVRTTSPGRRILRHTQVTPPHQPPA